MLFARSGRIAEDEVDGERKHEVESVDQSHHDDDEDKHDTGVSDEFAAGRSDDLPEFVDDLTKE